MMHGRRLVWEEKQSASNRTPRQINRNLIFNQIRTRQPISRADLARSSGLQRSTVSIIVEELLAAGWVVEDSMGDSRRGRRPTFLVVNPRRAVIAVDIHPARAMLAMIDLNGHVSGETVVPFPEDPKRVIGAMLRAIAKLIATHRDRSFEGIGINLPGRFNHQIGKAIFAPNVQWPIGEIKLRVEKATGLTTVVDNVANACALSEVWFGASDGTCDLVVVNVSEGIGTGIFANGRLLRGNEDAAGEFGHVQLDPQGLQCNCGSRGCWETMASNRAAVRYYQQSSGRSAPSFEEILQLAEAKDKFAVEALTKMCAALGRGMHMVVSALAPGEIILVGEITRLWPLISPVIEAELRRFPLIGIPTLRMASNPDTARLRSAVALVMHTRLL